MGSTLLEHPPRRAAPPRPPSTPPAATRRRRTRSGWVFPAALAVSALLHLILLITLRFQAPSPGFRQAPIDGVIERPEGMRVYDIVAVEGPGTPLPDETATPQVVPPPTPRVTAPLVPPRAAAADAPPVAETTPERTQPESLADRLNPRMVDPRLWGPPSATRTPTHPDDVVRDRIAERLGAYNDSMRLAEEAANRAVDWTVKDKDGGRWGVSPGKLHLGSITLPLPIEFMAPPGRRDDVNAARRNWSEIQAQRGQAEVREEVKDRIKAIRERKENERRDTTRISG